MISIVPGEVLGGHDGLIPRVAFSPDGQRFAVGDDARQARRAIAHR